jgi:hypothetical protein
MHAVDNGTWLAEGVELVESASTPETQVPSLQVCPLSSQSPQTHPSMPQAASVVPATHRPPRSQHPLHIWGLQAAESAWFRCAA